MWRYAIPSSFYDVEFDEEGKCWKVEASYFEEKLSFKIDAAMGNVSSLKVEKIKEKQPHRSKERISNLAVECFYLFVLYLYRLGLNPGFFVAFWFLTGYSCFFFLEV